ncbi:MAG TPA: FAD-dependent oxidoreductase, partial [Thermoguttaceae bacterium]|nr:FAD-dependent oxidoreductase [Thermoguttaceae bacterium]
PKKVDGLLIPVPVSGTHIGFSTLRMEPCWMALGQAAGTAACVAIDDQTQPRKIGTEKLQARLLAQDAVLVYFQDAKPGDAHYDALQYFALRGFFGPEQWQAKLDQPATEKIAEEWSQKAGVDKPTDYAPGKTTRGELLAMLLQSVGSHNQ